MLQLKISNLKEIRNRETEEHKEERNTGKIMLSSVY